MGRLPTQPQIVAALRQVELFSAIDDGVLMQIAAVARPRDYDRGELLFVEGEQGDALLVIVSGSVTVFRTSADGERAALTVLEPPEVLGEIALLDGAPRSASVEATEATLVLALSRAEFFSLLRNQPTVLEPLMRQLGQMVRRLTEQAADHVFLDLAGRVAKSLLRLANGGSPPVVAITQSRLAEMSGGTRQSVNQVLGGFAQRGLVHLEGRRVLLTDVPGLRRRAHLPPDPAGRPGVPVRRLPVRRAARSPSSPKVAARAPQSSAVVASESSRKSQMRCTGTSMGSVLSGSTKVSATVARSTPTTASWRVDARAPRSASPRLTSAARQAPTRPMTSVTVHRWARLSIVAASPTPGGFDG
jgi:CRP-like cAMP-binding protein